ncbi:MAG: PfkB family carbohydrate kinase [Planctomycetota bacterium]
MLTPNVVPDFTALRVAVVGDPIADHYLYARPTRLSREAPVMVMRHTGEEFSPGGAANVARNLWTFGARTRLFGAVGRDATGRELIARLQSDAIDVEGVATVPGWATPTKTRIMGAEQGRRLQQVLRIDREPDSPVPIEALERVASAVQGLAGEVDAVLVSDYGYGVARGPVKDAILELARSGVRVVVDARDGYRHFGGVAAMTPNLGELAHELRIPFDELERPEDLARAAARFREEFGPRALLVTRGNEGMSWFDDEHPGGLFVGPSGSATVVDVSGAGDTAAGALTLALAAGLGGPRAMRLANAAAGVVVMESGATVCSLSKLRSALPNSPQPQVLSTTVEA